MKKKSDKSFKQVKEFDQDIVQDIDTMLASPDLWQTTDELVDMIMLAKGRVFDGTPYWAYVKVPPSKLLQFRMAMENGANNILDYGFIIAIGYTEHPPEDIQKEMEKDYPIQHSFEEQVVEEAKAMYDRIMLKEKYTSGSGESE